MQPEEVLLRIKKTGAVEELTVPMLHLVIRYIEMLDAKDPARSFSLIEIFVKYGNEEAVVRALQKWEFMRSNEVLDEDVTMIKTQLVTWWVAERKMPDDVFSSLRLDKTVKLAKMKSARNFDVKVELLKDFIELSMRIRRPVTICSRS